MNKIWGPASPLKENDAPALDGECIVPFGRRYLTLNKKRYEQDLGPASSLTEDDAPALDGEPIVPFGRRYLTLIREAILDY